MAGGTSRSLLDTDHVRRGEAEGKIRAHPRFRVRSFRARGRILHGGVASAQKPQDLEEGEFVSLLQEVELQIKGRFPILAGHRYTSPFVTSRTVVRVKWLIEA
ncbi:MAG: hypothetical protein OHK0028_03280 [Deltaproteobacteria bacterium]